MQKDERRLSSRRDGIRSGNEENLGNLLKPLLVFAYPENIMGTQSRRRYTSSAVRPWRGLVFVLVSCLSLPLIFQTSPEAAAQKQKP